MDEVDICVSACVLHAACHDSGNRNRDIYVIQLSFTCGREEEEEVFISPCLTLTTQEVETRPDCKILVLGCSMSVNRKETCNSRDERQLESEKQRSLWYLSRDPFSMKNVWNSLWGALIRFK